MACDKPNSSASSSELIDEDIRVIMETPLQSEAELSESGSSTNEGEGIEIQCVGVPFDYTIPSFNCISFTIRQITFKAVDDGTINIYHGFIRNNPCLETYEYPRSIDVFESCFVKVEEFCKSAPAHHLKHPDKGVYLVWQWDWVSTNASAMDSGSEGSFEGEKDEEKLETEHVTKQQTVGHNTVLDTLRFKVIGATRDKNHQVALEKANEVIRSDREVYVALCKEPKNPFDAKAIAFICHLDNQWHRIGYIVREALSDVHEALSTHAIRSVKFGWVKFRIDFQHSGPGFYAGVDITRIGCWSSTVHACASPK